LHGSVNRITFLSGTVESLNETNSSVNIAQADSPINPNLFYGTGKGSRFEVNNPSYIARVGSLSFVRFISDNEIYIHSGSFLFCSKYKKFHLKIRSRKSSATFVGSGTFIIDCLENGGFKFIPLECEASLSTDKHPTKKLIEGQLLLVVGSPSYLGNAYDIDIMLLLQSSRLINNFPSPLPTFDQIGLAIYVQNLKLKGKYDALIGDAKTEKSLQIWGFGEEAKP
jgi:hypothetical protein